MSWLRTAIAGGLLTLGLGATGCFSDIPNAGQRDCPAGGDTCRCKADDGCEDGLVCESDEYCRSERCAPGLPNCACQPSGDCNEGLSCIEGSCLVPEEPSTSGATVPPPSNDDDGSGVGTSGVGPGTSGSDPSDSDPSDPTNASDPTASSGMGMTSGVATTGDEESTGSMSGSDSSDNPEFDPSCGCGWDTSSPGPLGPYYWCVPTGTEVVDPGGVSPVCPTSVTAEGVLMAMATEAVPCDFGSDTADWAGCCFGGVAVFCSEGQLATIDCMNAGEGCFPG